MQPVTILSVNHTRARNFLSLQPQCLDASMSDQSSPGDKSQLLDPKSRMASAIYEQHIKFQNRNAEEVHEAALAAAYAAHTAIREEAIRVAELHQLRRETEHLRKRAAQEEERVRVAHAKALEEIKIREAENKAKQIPQPPPRVPTPITQPIPEEANSKSEKLKSATTNPTSVEPAPSKPSSETLTASSSTSQPVNASAPLSQLSNTSYSQQQSTASASNGQDLASRRISSEVLAHHALPKATPVNEHFSTVTADPDCAVDIVKALQHLPRYAAIHKCCKQLRQFVTQQDKAFVNQAGEMRRIIKRSVGQLVPASEAAANAKPRDAIVKVLLESLNTVPSELVDPSMFFLTTPEPVPDAKYNDKMPILFMYLLNIFSKAVVSQFVTECSVKEEAANALGLLIMMIFPRPEFTWRNTSFISIFIAKITVTCPVLFGVMGSEKTEEGRAKLGWKKDVNGNWMSQEEHYDRMAGVAAGFAAVTLRNFSKSLRANPYPPYHFWLAIAQICRTPDDKISPTQLIVLKGLLKGNVKKFLIYFGDYGLLTLKTALVDFPSRAPASSAAAAGSLKALADTLERDNGLKLRA